jgi:Ca2+/Na+ antiporter
MTDERDPRLSLLFAESQDPLDEEAFIEQVLERTRNIKYRISAAIALIVLIIATSAWYLSIPIELAQILAQVLTTSVVELGSGWLGLILSPINNMGGLIVISVKALRVGWKKMMNVA